MSTIRMADTAVLDAQDPPQGIAGPVIYAAARGVSECGCLWRQLSCSRRLQLPPLRERSS